MRYEVTLEGREATVDVEHADGGWRLRIDDGDWQMVPGRFVQPGELRLSTTGEHGPREQTVGIHVSGERVALQVAGHPLEAVVIDPRSAKHALGGGAAEGVLQTPMPGVVVRIPVEAGQQVAEGEVVVVVEAMKMENEFKAPIDGVVSSIDVEVGQALEANATLAVVEPA